LQYIVSSVTLRERQNFLASVFAVFVAKKETVHKNCSYFKVTRTRIQNPYYWKRLLSEYTQTCVYYNLHTGVLVAQWFGRQTFDQAVMGSIPGQGIVKTLRSTQPSIPPGR